MPRYRHRSTSYGSLQDHQQQKLDDDLLKDGTSASDVESAKTMLTTLLELRDRSGKAFLHKPLNLNMARALLERAKCLDETSDDSEAKIWQRRCLLQLDKESGYTPIHYAIIERNLALILLFLRHAMDTQSSGRLPKSPMAALHGNINSHLIQEMTSCVDKEGLTPLQLLGRLQRSELANCRRKLLSRPKVRPASQRRQRQCSFDEDGQEELGFLADHMDLLEPVEEVEEEKCDYACEVVTFGRPHHSALGVISSHGDQHAFRPQRVQEFAQDSIGREGSAVAIAAATHHTLVVTKNGHLYACGLAKGGRLGMGEAVQHCPLPRRVLGPLSRRKVVGVAAAENHSLCVTNDGALFTWGSNRFGQLGLSEGKATATPNQKGNSTNHFRCLPRRVEDLRNITCIAVAAGDKHSVALTRKGEVYVWGDNTAGQLGISRRTGIQKVQRVEALWNSSPPKISIAISAAEHSTLVLTSPNTITHVNSVYSWGHGNHVPIRVHFDNSNPSRRAGDSLSSRTNRVINPVAIACGKYHNAAITLEGHVYSWGLHAESLGRSNTNKHQRNSTSGRSTSSPQLVTGMLPENGGGVAVALSASDQHTAVVTECGGLFTWGTSYGTNALGHEGVKWQPSPKRVPGVHQAVGVAVAKEHTALLIGSSFPKIPELPKDKCCSLDLLASRKVALHVDLFNVIPILIMAERAESNFLIEHCMDFIHRNLDGVLNVGKKSEMNQYLNDMLADSLHCSWGKFRDDHHHPFIFDVLTAGNAGRPTFNREFLSTLDEWVKGCTELSQKPVVQKLISSLSICDEESLDCMAKIQRKDSSFSNDSLLGRSQFISCESNQEPKNSEMRGGSLDLCIKETANMDLSTSELAKEKSIWLAKEIRGVRKKLNQIKKLQELDEAQTTALSFDERTKVDRLPIFESELIVYESALKEVETRIKELGLEERIKQKEAKMSEILKDSIEKDKVLITAPSLKPGEDAIERENCVENEKTFIEEKQEEKRFACNICGIKCPDKRSFELHKSGRKHRNRVAQVAEEEKRKMAASIMERHQVEQVKGSDLFSRTPPVTKQLKKAWGSNGSTQPKFKLPPPPHPAVPQVPIDSPSIPWQTGCASPSIARSTNQALTSFAAFTNVTKKGTKKANDTTPKKISVSPGLPVWSSSSGSPQSISLSASSSPASAPFSSPDHGQKNSYSLADFLTPSKPEPIAKSRKPKTWTTSQSNTPVATKTFAEIQAEEADFKSRQDKSYEKAGGTWFIERRERANSLSEIQKSTRKEQEERAFIEEQRRIEEQIYKELASQRNQGRQRSQSKKKAGTQQKKSKGNKKGTNNGKSNPPNEGNKVHVPLSRQKQSVN